MKQVFIERNFSDKSLGIITKAEEIMDEYEADGLSLTLRQLYYQFVSKNLLENSEKSYDNLGSVINDARLAGLLDWDIIKDRGRVVRENSHWENPGEIVDMAALAFRLDRWKNQHNYVEVMVEKQALEGILEPVCRRNHVNLTANKGYASATTLYEAGRRYYDKLCEDKNVHIIYLGDHDPSGVDMTRDVMERCRLFAQSYESDIENGGVGVHVHRVALNMDQIRQLNPPPNPAKFTDSRAKAYVAQYGRSSWELDAVEPRRMAKIVEDQILSLRDDDKWDDTLAEEEAMKAQLRTIASKIIKKPKGKK